MRYVRIHYKEIIYIRMCMEKQYRMSDHYRHCTHTKGQRNSTGGLTITDTAYTKWTDKQYRRPTITDTAYTKGQTDSTGGLTITDYRRQ